MEAFKAALYDLVQPPNCKGYVFWRLGFAARPKYVDVASPELDVFVRARFISVQTAQEADIFVVIRDSAPRRNKPQVRTYAHMALIHPEDPAQVIEVPEAGEPVRVSTIAYNLHHYRVGMPGSPFTAQYLKLAPLDAPAAEAGQGGWHS